MCACRSPCRAAADFNVVHNSGEGTAGGGRRERQRRGARAAWREELRAGCRCAERHARTSPLLSQCGEPNLLSLSLTLSLSLSLSHSLTLTLSLSLSHSLSLSLSLALSLSHTHHKLALTLTLTHSPSVPCSLASKRRRPAEPPRAATDQGAGTRHNAQLRWNDTPPGKGRGSDPGAACRSRRGRCASGIYPGRRCAAATDSWSRYAAAAHTWSRCAAAAHTWSRCAAAAHTWSRCAAAANARSLEFPGPQLHR